MGGSGDAGDDAKCMQETPPYNSSAEWGIESGQLACSDEMEGPKDPRDRDPGDGSSGGDGPNGAPDKPHPRPPSKPK